MEKKKAKKITAPPMPQDYHLWETVKKSVAPLHKTNASKTLPLNIPAQPIIPQSKTPPISPASISKAAAKSLPAPSFISVTKASPASKSRPAIIEKNMYRKISQGRIRIEGKIDLHNLREEEAYAQLAYFIKNAYARKKRTLLVITGKGRSMGSTALLKRSVPHWLSSPYFQQWVSGFEEASVSHGGGGALYIRLRSALHAS